MGESVMAMAGTAEGVGEGAQHPGAPVEVTIEEQLAVMTQRFQDADKIIRGILRERSTLQAERDAFRAAMIEARVDADLLNTIVRCFTVNDEGFLAQAHDLNLWDELWVEIREASSRATARSVLADPDAPEDVE